MFVCFFPHDIHPSEFNQSLPKSQLYTVDPSEGLLSQTEQSLHKLLLCVYVWGALPNPTVPPSLIPNYQSPFSMVVQFQEHLIWVFERRLIQELGVVPGGSRLLEEMGFSSILSSMFRDLLRWESTLLLHPYISFSNSISLTTLLPAAGTYCFFFSQLGAYVHMCAHMHCICLHIQAFAHMCAPGQSAPQQSHTDTLSHLTIPPYIWSLQIGHTPTHTQRQKEKTSNIALFISVFHLQNPMVNPGS